ncbi:Abi family protein [Brevibacterium picturae]|uniref:Abi family protein n=1 Tax=Brevibacterium picturae TaxID=260553 RepID=UPI003D159353
MGWPAGGTAATHRPRCLGCTSGRQGPVWVSVELRGWGGLARLYGFAPRPVQNAVADACGMGGRQLTSWLRALNLVRNISTAWSWVGGRCCPRC